MHVGSGNTAPGDAIGDQYSCQESVSDCVDASAKKMLLGRDDRRQKESTVDVSNP
jgi:hypothetical protein